MPTASASTAGVYRAEKRSTSLCVGALEACASSTRCMSLARVESADVAVTETSRRPEVLRVPANTLSPRPLSTATGSPVTDDSSTPEAPRSTIPSSAIRSPGRTTIVSPTATSAGVTSTSALPRFTLTRAGARDMSALIDALVRARDLASSAFPTAKSTTTVAPSLHSPMEAAPITAIVMSTFMSRERARIEPSARLAVRVPPARIARANPKIDQDCMSRAPTAQPAA